MSRAVIERVLKTSRQQGSALATVLILAHRANDRSVCFLKLGTLMAALKLEKRQVLNLMDKLVAAKELEIRRNTSGQHLANYYLVKGGDEAVVWPEDLPQQRTPSATADGCNPLHGRVQSSTTTGAILYTDGCNPLPERVQSLTKEPSRKGGRVQSVTKTGAIPYHPLKESERNKEHEVSTSSYTVPPALSAFHSELIGQSGYEPTESFFTQVLKKYSTLDLVEEAMGMVSWLDTPNKKFGGRSPREAGRKCSNLFVLGWLKRALNSSSREGDNHGESGRGDGGGNGEYSAANGSPRGRSVIEQREGF